MTRDGPGSGGILRVVEGMSTTDVWADQPTFKRGFSSSPPPPPFRAETRENLRKRRRRRRAVGRTGREPQNLKEIYFPLPPFTL